MFSNVELSQLESHSLEEIKGYKSKAAEEKAQLEALKAKSGKDWTKEKQDELDEVVLFLVDVEDIIEKKQKEESSQVAKTTKAKYVPKKGTEKMVHLSIVKGRRFNPMSGKEESKPYIQVFTYSEWQLFKSHHKSLGYSIMSVLHDPYEEASEYVVKK